MQSSLRFPRYNIANENRYGEYSQDFKTSSRRKRLYVGRKAPDVRAFARKVRGNRKDVAERLKKDRIRALPLVLPHESRVNQVESQTLTVGSPPMRHGLIQRVYRNTGSHRESMAGFYPNRVSMLVTLEFARNPGNHHYLQMMSCSSQP